MSTGVNHFDDLMKRSHGGSVDDQVAKDPCANTNLFGGGLAFKVDANVIRADGIGMKANTLQVFDGREGWHRVSVKTTHRASVAASPVSDRSDSCTTRYMYEHW
jgi:hypothetical protein